MSRFWRRRVGDIDEEIESHLRMAVADRVERGESPEEARLVAMREFGNVPMVRETTQRMWGWEWVDRVGQDLRYAWRQLRRSPGFAATVIATLAVGLGATAAMFTVVERVLLQTLPYKDARGLVAVRESGRRGDETWVPWLDIDAWRQKTRSFEEIAFFNQATGRPFLEGDAGAQQIGHYLASLNLFRVLGVEPAMGAGFRADKSAGFAATGDENTIVLSDAAWRDSFGADAKILGRVVKINDHSYTVVGVMPRGFRFPMEGTNPQVWTPVWLKDDDKTRAHHSPTYTVVARLRRGVSVASADAEMKAVQADVAKEYADPYDRDLVVSAKVERYGDTLVKTDVKRILLALFGASGVLWLIACVNVTGLLLARGTARQREIAVRGALGASRARIVQQLLLEGLMWSAGASVLGLALAVGLLKVFSHGLTTQLHVEGAMPNGRAIAVLLALTIASAVVSSMWPALVSARASIEPALRQGAAQSGGSSRSHHRVRALLVVAQIAMSLMLLVSCGLLLRTIYALRHAPLGFRTDHIIVGNMAIPAYKFAGQDMTMEFYKPLLERVKAMPGVESASFMTEVPLGHTFNMVFSFSAEGNSADSVKRRDFRAQFRAVGPEVQKVFGFAMAKGRFFNEGDTPGSQAVVVVNRAFVREFSASNDPEKIMGQRLMSLEKDKPAIVVGVLDDTRLVSVAEQSQPEIEVCLPQLTPGSGFYKSAEGIAMDLAVRTERSPASIVPELRELMRRSNSELANTKFTTMDQIVEDSYGNQQVVARLLMVFGASALLLCLAGLYGLLAYLVTQRTRELGVRIALGAKRGDVMWLVMRQAGWMLVWGSVAGLVMAYFTSRFVGSFLYGVKPHDGWTLAVVSTLLLASGLGAAYVPARRAAAVDPMEALRAE